MPGGTVWPTRRGGAVRAGGAAAWRGPEGSHALAATAASATPCQPHRSSRAIPAALSRPRCRPRARPCPHRGHCPRKPTPGAGMHVAMPDAWIPRSCGTPTHVCCGCCSRCMVCVFQRGGVAPIAVRQARFAADITRWGMRPDCAWTHPANHNNGKVCVNKERRLPGQALVYSPGRMLCARPPRTSWFLVPSCAPSVPAARIACVGLPLPFPLHL